MSIKKLLSVKIMIVINEHILAIKGFSCLNQV